MKISARASGKGLDDDGAMGWQRIFSQERKLRGMAMEIWVVQVGGNWDARTAWVTGNAWNRRLIERQSWYDWWISNRTAGRLENAWLVFWFQEDLADCGGMRAWVRAVIDLGANGGDAGDGTAAGWNCTTSRSCRYPIYIGQYLPDLIPMGNIVKIHDLDGNEKRYKFCWELFTYW